MFQKRPNLALGFILVYFLVLTVGMRNSNGSEASSVLKTPHEKSNFKSYTSHLELEQYLKKLSSFNSQMKLVAYGKTYQGRNLPLVVFSKEGITDPKIARKTGKPIILIGANIHGDERTLRESVLVLMRELVRKDSHMNRLLDDIIIIITPSMNPDGFEASKEGSRKNALGVDMNRDYMKLEQVSLFQFVKNILHTWKPHLWVDGHNGGRFPYHLSYLCSTNAGVSKALSGFCNKKLLPFITEKLKQKEYKSFYYQRGNKSFWSIGGHKTRIGRNYGGLINIISVLFESPNWQNKELGFKSGLVGLRAVLEFSSLNKDQILSVTKSTKKKVVKLGKNGEGNIVVKMKYGFSNKRVSYLIGGKKVGSKREIIKVKNAKIKNKIIPVKTRPRPFGYLLKPGFEKSINLLKRHSIKISKLKRDHYLNVDSYIIKEIEYKKVYDHKKAVSVTIEGVSKDKVMFPKGSYYIKTGQELGALVTQLLEPETSDNIVKWNTMDFALPSKVDGYKKFVLPIYKLTGQGLE